MANHGFITAKKNLDKKQIALDLQEINERRFGGQLKIEDSEWGDKGSWFISYQDKRIEYPMGFNIWITSKRKLEHRHSRGYAYYVELVFSEELGAKYNAIMSDEGHDDKWKPAPEKFAKFQDWIDIQYSHIKKAHPIAYKMMSAMEKKSVPKGFEKF
jgi:hypothetical protein